MLKKKLLFLLIVFVVGLFLISVLLQSDKKVKVNEGLIPEEVAHKQGYIKYLTPPDDFKASLAWMQAIHDVREEGESKVEIDWMRLYARVNGRDKLITSDEYDDKKACGGLWQRDPWFGKGLTGGEEFPIYFDENSYLILEVNRQPDKVWHWWSCKRAVIPDDVEQVWMEARVKIKGPALVQAGIDYWRTVDAPYVGPKINNKEAAVSDWFFEEDDWQIISVAKPK